MQRVANDRIVRRLHRHVRQKLRVAGQDRRQRRVDVEPGFPQRLDCAQAVGDRFASRLEYTADAVVVGGERKADAQVGMFAHRTQQLKVAQDVS